MGELERANGSVLGMPGILSPTSLNLPPDLSRDEWLQIGETLTSIEEGLKFWRGDWLAFGERRSWGETYTQAMEATGLSYSTLSKEVWVARAIPPESRDGELSWAHHAEVADLEEEDRGAWFEKAKFGDDGNQWSAKRLREEIKAAEMGGVVDEIPCPKCSGTGLILKAQPTDVALPPQEEG